MYTVTKFIFIVLSLTTAQNSYAWPELPFCPSGGPPGWMNYFDYKRDKNNWRNHFRNQNFQRYYSAQPERHSSFQNSPDNNSTYPPGLRNQQPIIRRN